MSALNATLAELQAEMKSRDLELAAAREDKEQVAK